MGSKSSTTSTTVTTATTSPVRNAISAFGARLTRALSQGTSEVEGGQGQGPSRAIPVGRTSDVDGSSAAVLVRVGLPGVGASSTDIQSLNNSHSPARGREIYSTGRGGAGNIHRSQSRDATGVPAPTSPPPPVGREASPTREPITHVGRGGLGNFRDPSRPREHAVDLKDVIYEHEVIEHSEDSPHRFSTGRGGAGNIKTTPENSHSRERDRSLSPVVDRSLSRGRALHSTGRGGAGNITSEPLQEEEAFVFDELERHAHSPARHHQGELHSTGRGGLANVTALGSPPVEHVHEGHEVGEGTGVVSYGRGGAGNIRDRSGSRGGGPRSGSGRRLPIG